MDVTVYTLTYNEEMILPYFINHYRSAFPGCRIVIYDNESTDNTIKIALNNDCEIIVSKTNGKIDDDKYLTIKNHCWKDATTNWCLICDIDEFLQIDHTVNLDHFSIVKTVGYNMHNLNERFYNIDSIKFGTREMNYDKSIMINKSLISEINYTHGAHSINPKGNIKYTDCSYKLLHYHFIDLPSLILKYKDRASRLSKNNLKLSLGSHYEKSEQEIRQKYFRRDLIKVL